MKGLVFDVKEFAVHDGEGIRTTVFFKGCPLRCVWCHNPEGLSPERELYVTYSNCTGCGLCQRGCDHPECKSIGRCLHICPLDLVKAAGEEWEVEALAEKLLRHKDFFNSMGGGVTLSGGEPLMQWEFCVALLKLLRPHIHVAIETSGAASSEVFRQVTELCDFVFMDIKLADPEAHKRFTGADNSLILKNAEHLKNSNIPHVFRTPLIPGITDTEENLLAISRIVSGSEWERLSYNELAPVKYKNVGREYVGAKYIDPARILKNK